MGQQQSAEKSSAPPRSGTPQAEKERKVNRRVSLQALSHGRGPPVDPSASKDNAIAQTTSHNLEKPDLQQYLQSTTSDNMPFRTTKVERSTSKATKKPDQEMKPKPLPIATPQPSGPMNVPTAAKSKQEEYIKSQFEDTQDGYHDRRYTPVAQLRPPRLPLPIADVSIPESPTLMPVDKGNADVPIFETDDPLSANEAHLRRRSSMVSNTTQDEEDVAEELQPYAVAAIGHTVPTVIEWKQPGNRVYVTGTFANWERKHRLHRR